jgi:hypothetical protein
MPPAGPCFFQVGAGDALTPASRDRRDMPASLQPPEALGAEGAWRANHVQVYYGGNSTVRVDDVLLISDPLGCFSPPGLQLAFDGISLREALKPQAQPGAPPATIIVLRRVNLDPQVGYSVQSSW